MIIVPSIGEQMVLSVGIIANPSPIILVENTLSGTFSISTHLPSTGATTPSVSLPINLNITN
ncbi:hypothetical protein D3C81_2291320 [compost metagenome]